MSVPSVSLCEPLTSFSSAVSDPVERARLENLDGLRGGSHITDLDVLETDAMLLEVVVRHDLQRIELEGAERLAFQLLWAVQSGLRNDHAALDAATSDDLDRSAGIEQRHEARVGHQADSDLTDAEERDLFGKCRRVDELYFDAVILRSLQGVRQEDIEIAEAGAMGGLEGARRRVSRAHQAATDGHRQRGGRRGLEHLAAAEVRRSEVRQVHAAGSIAHGLLPPL